MKQIVSAQLGSNTVTIETGRMAKQADGSVLVSCGNNMVLVTAVSSKKESTLDFFPSDCRIPGKILRHRKNSRRLFQREGRPTTNATLTARLIDRPIRPCFPEGYRNETQVIATTLSFDGSFPIEVLASVGASAALHISAIPFNGPTAAVRVGRIDGKLIENPSMEEMERSDMDIMVAGTPNGLLMVEGGSKFVSEADVLAALKFAHQSMRPFFDMQDELRSKTGSQPRARVRPENDRPRF